MYKLLIILLLLLAGCGNKKKLLEVNKGYEVEKNRSERVVESVVHSDTKVNNNVTVTGKDALDVKTVEEYIFDSAGRIQSYKKINTDKSKRDVFYAKLSNIITELKGNVKSKSSEQKESEKETEVKNLDLTKTSKNPIWHWIGGAIALCIVGVVIWKVILKK